MGRGFVLVIGFFISTYATAQLPVWHGDFTFSSDSVRPTDYIGLVSEYSINSNSITNDFLNHIQTSSFIDDEMKQSVLNNAQNNIRVGLVLDAALWYKHRLKKHNLNLVFNLRGRSFRTIETSKDLLNLLLNGNTDSQGETLTVSPTRFSNYIHQEVYFGAEKMYDSLGLLIGGGIAIQKLSTHTHLEITNSTLYTAPQGRYIDFDINYLERETRSGSTNNLTRFEGIGATINLYAEKQFKNKSRIAFDLRDVGFIRMSNEQTSKIDTSGRWDGVEVDDFSNPNFGSDFPSGGSVNDIFDLSPTIETGTLRTTGSINISYYRELSPKFYGYVGLNQYFTSAYKPRIYARPYYQMAKSIAVGLPIAYGGFGYFDVGLSFKGKLFKNYHYTVDVHYLESVLIPKSSSGQGFNFGLSAMF